MDNDKPDKDENKKPENPLDELKKQLEGIFGGKPVKLEFGSFPPPPEADSGFRNAPQQDDDSEEVLRRIREFSM